MGATDDNDPVENGTRRITTAPSSFRRKKIPASFLQVIAREPDGFPGDLALPLWSRCRLEILSMEAKAFIDSEALDEVDQSSETRNKKVSAEQ